MGISIKHVSKSYGEFHVLKDINLEIKKGELISLLGPSGSGKTTLLRIIAGLEQADQGSILFEGADQTNVHVKNRNVGFVFQHYALFRNMTVFENVAYGLKVRPRKERLSKKEIKQKVDELLNIVRLKEFGERYPSQLSGGQRQRVALARALAVNPQVLLLDEPFGALDAKVRKELRRWLRKVHDEFHITSVFVTHDQEEALDISDRVVIMNDGRIEQVGTPEAVYEMPENPFVYDFLGTVNQFKGLLDSGYIYDGNFKFEVPGDVKTIKTAASGVGFARPHHFIVEKTPNDESGIHCQAEHIRAIGSTVQLELKRTDTGDIIEIELTKEYFLKLQITVGDDLYVRPKQLKVFCSS